MSSSRQRFYSPGDITDSIESMENIHGKDRPYIFWLFLVCIGATIASIFYIKVDVSVAGSGLIRPEQERLQVISTVSGYISELHVSDNQPVIKGDVLLRFESKSIHAKLDYCKTELSENARILNDLETLGNRTVALNQKLLDFESEVSTENDEWIEVGGLESPRMQKEYANFSGQVERQRIELEKANHDFQRIKRLRAKNFISSQDYEDKKHERDSALRMLKITILQKANEWQAEFEERTLKASSLDSQFKQLKEQTKLYEIKAPSDGIAIGFRGLQEGLLISQGQKIGEISPSSELLAEVYISTKDIGFVSIGQETKVLIDAFPHTEWGTLTGNVKEISSDFIQLGEEIAFRAIIQLEKLHLRSRKGITVEIKRGMTINSRFLVRERTLFDVLFSKMSDAFDPRENN